MKNVVQSVLECSASPENWEGTLDGFTIAFEISNCALFSVHEFAEMPANFYFSALSRANNTPVIIETMRTGGDVDDAKGYQFMFENEPLRLYDEMTLFGVTEFEDLPPSAIRDWIGTWGLKVRSTAMLNKNGPWMDGLFCQHATLRECRSFVMDKRADVILPIMSNSVALGRTLQALRSRFHASLAVLDALGLAVFLVDETGCVIERNKEAQRLLDLADGMSLTSSKRLKLQAPDKTSELDTMVSAANGLLRGDLTTTHSLMASERPSGAYDYLISVRSLSDSQAELETGLKCAFVTVIDPSRDGVLSAEGITALGQLTQAESEVVDLLVQGFRPSDVAERRDVSLNTVKTQLKDIAQKLRCSTQSDIIRVAAATRVPIKEN